MTRRLVFTKRRKGIESSYGTCGLGGELNAPSSAVKGGNSINAVGADELELYALGRIRRDSEVAKVGAEASRRCNQHVAAFKYQRIPLVLNCGVVGHGNQRVRGLDDGRSAGGRLYPVSRENRERICRG